MYFLRVCVSQVTPILNGFVPEVIFTTPTGKMIREKFSLHVCVCILYIYIYIYNLWVTHAGEDDCKGRVRITVRKKKMRNIGSFGCLQYVKERKIHLSSRT